MPGYDSIPNFPSPAGGVVASTAALVDITPVPAYSVPAGALTVGSTFRVTAMGRYTTGTTATNALIGVYLGGTGGVLLAGTAAATALTISLTNAPWRLEYTFKVRAVGTGATATTVWGQGFVLIGGSLTAFGSPQGIPSTANATVTVDSTVAKALSIGATLSQVVGAPTITCDEMLVENLTTIG